MPDHTTIFYQNIPQDQQGVFMAGKVNPEFESWYLKAREVEQRVLNDEQVKILPKIESTHPHYDEWHLRSKSADRFEKYLSGKQETKLLEIGCGNGWFTHICSKSVKHAVGVDVNLLELHQAQKVFSAPNLSFCYWNIFEENPFETFFDIVVFNASIQYFEELDALFERVCTLLSPEGELHIIDSPFYYQSELQNAKSRTEQYYKNAGIPEMIKYYHHHSYADLRGFEKLYTPPGFISKKLLGKKDSPFGWYRKYFAELSA